MWLRRKGWGIEAKRDNMQYTFIITIPTHTLVVNSKHLILLLFLFPAQRGVSERWMACPEEEDEY